jgi:glycosyltransferase involved in cell wall biosynthesis
LKIAQVAPLHESVPPRFYGGTERVVAHLTEELVLAGHDVTLFASGDSVTSARLIAPCRRALRLGGEWTDPVIPHLLLLEKVFSQADEFDIIHFHTDSLHLPLCRRSGVPSVATAHGRLDLPDVHRLMHEYAEMPMISISDHQRRPLPNANWKATIHHGLPRTLYSLGSGRGGYLAFAGRMSKEKRPDLAIRIAREAGLPLRMAAKVDRADAEYFDQVVRPLLRGPGVEFIGEIDDAQKNAFFGDALAVLFPIDWPEPFGIVMIEAMACGTPVIASRCGSVPEIMVHGRTGFIVDTPEEAVRAVDRLHRLDRSGCRRVFNERFTSDRMAGEYTRVYQRIAMEHEHLPRRQPRGVA